MTRRPPVIGIVGGIGAGKSEVARALAELGCVVSDSDLQAHTVLGCPEVVEQLVARWGTGALAPDATPNRSAIGRIVFADAAERAWLESIIHPRLEATRRAIFAAHPDARAHVIDAPLLLEAGLGPTCDAIVFVDAPAGERLRRVQCSRGWTQAEWNRREATQWPLDQKRKMSHHVVCNDGDPASLRVSVRAVLDLIDPAPSN
ncbi:MAG: dephospho-CoA kinase [Planctomycetota bacterium]|nr:dephospho-CoA kinase [Planctomycetota bacterium]MDA1105324.1 dephospho-CoA kinase [Planctomycetota bacterium]